MIACAAWRIGPDGALVACTEPVAYRCVRTWEPLADIHVCAEHRPPDARSFAHIYFVGSPAVLSRRVVPLEALRERRRQLLSKRK